MIKYNFTNKYIYFITSVVLFSLLYYYYRNDNFVITNNFNNKMTYFDCLYFSVVTQSLLGPGDIEPKSKISRSIVMLQTLFTMFLTLNFIL